MKRPINKIILAFLFIFSVTGPEVYSQVSAKSDLSLGLSYFSTNNKIPYLLVKAKTKIKGRFTPVGGVTLKLYLNTDSAENLIKEVITDEKGEAFAFVPPSLKGEWGHTPKKTFLAVFGGDSSYEPGTADLTISEAKIVIDTTGERKIVATILERKDTGWVAVKGVDVAIAIKRMDGYLNVNPTATFSTDSLGQATADFKRDQIPGDEKGDIVLVAKVDDNDTYGNLLQQMKVPWGAKTVAVNTFGARTLFATRDKAPIWLLLMVYSIVASVWGILAYLVVNLIRIRKIGVI